MFIKLSIICLSFFGAALGQCSFHYGRHLPLAKEPIYVRKSKPPQIYPPENKLGAFSVAQNEEMFFLCTRSATINNYVILRVNNVNTNTGRTILEAKCFNNRILLSNNQQVNFDDIGCANMPKSEIKDVNSNNPNANKSIKIGFRVSPTDFIDIYYVFFNPVLKTTYYAISLLQPNPYDCDAERPDFRADGFGLIAAALKRDYDAKKRQSGAQIDRGHLVPKCDFFTGGEQYSTFYYVNSVPQLHDINIGNWKNLELDIRKAINRNHGAVLEAYTGASGVNQNYGYFHGTNQVPMPLILWKVLVDRKTKGGVAFIVINDNQRNYAPLCPDICSNILWLSTLDAAKRNRVASGQVYCCTIETFSKISSIKHPKFFNYVPGRLLTQI